MRAFDASSDAGDTHADRWSDEHPPVDWTRFDRDGDGTSLRDRTDEPLGRDGRDHRDVFDDPTGGLSDGRTDAPLIRADDVAADRTAVLDPELERVPVHDLYPSRFVDASSREDATVERARRTSEDPHEWAPLINPQHIDDVVAGRPEHTENCAACSRAVQETLDGVPQAAPGLAEGGLDVAGGAHDHGEHRAYTERWAGQVSEATTYEDIEWRLQSGDRSAIVFGSGDGGGHAFNAIRHGDDVLYVDGQTGEVSPWAPDYIRRTFPNVRAIFFGHGTRPATGSTPGGRR